MELAQRVLEGIWAVWSGERIRRRTLLAAGGCLFLLIILATLYLGALHQRKWGADVFIFLDGAWRVLNGQRPHADFYSGLGPISYLVFALGIWLTDLDASGLGYARVSVVLAIGLWSYGLLRRRLETVPLILFCLLVTLMAGTPVAMGDSVAATSHGAFYNRWGYAVLAILIAEAFLSSDDKHRDWLGGLSSGVALAVLLFLKASYFFVALVFLGWFLLLRPSMRRIAAVAAGALLASAPMAIYLRSGLAAMWTDIQTAAAVRTWSMKPAAIVENLVHTLGEGAVPILVAIALIAFGRERVKVREALRWSGLAVMAFGGGVLLMRSNSQLDGNPLLWVATVLLLNVLIGVIRESAPAEGSIDRALAAVVVLFGLASAAQALLVDSAGLSYAVVEKAWHRRPSEANIISVPHVRALVFDDYWRGKPGTNGRSYVAIVEEGLDLLRRHAQPSDRLVSLNNRTPFSYLLQWRPPRGGSTWLHFGNNYDDKNMIPASSMFDDATVVMVPKFSTSSRAQVMVEYYQPTLEGEFRIAAESKSWTLYLRDKR